MAWQLGLPESDDGVSSFLACLFINIASSLFGLQGRTRASRIKQLFIFLISCAFAACKLFFNIYKLSRTWFY
jgi:hypothetical protein